MKAAPEGQGKKANDKGKVMKPLGKGKKNVTKPTTSPATTAGPFVNLRSNLWDKAKHTAALIEEISEELQAIEEESTKDEQDSEATQESDLEQEDSDDYLMDGEQSLFKIQELPPWPIKPNKSDKDFDKTGAVSNEMEMTNQNINHTEEVIIGMEQGTTFPTKIGTSMCNALIDMGATKSCINKKYYQSLPLTKIQFIRNISVK